MLTKFITTLGLLISLLVATPAFAAPSGPQNFGISPTPPDIYIKTNTPSFSWSAPLTTTAPISYYYLTIDEDRIGNVGNTFTTTLPKTIASGSHTASLYAVDTNGAEGSLATTFFSVDTTVPSVPAITPVAATVNVPVTLRVAPTDNIEVIRCSYKVSGVDQGPMTKDNSNGTFYVERAFAGIQSYTVSASCSDKADNATNGPNTNIVVSAATPVPPAPPAPNNQPISTVVNNNTSYVLLSKSQLAPNTGEVAVITIVVRNASGNVLPNKYVTLTTNRPNSDTIINISATTNELGQAVFHVRSVSEGTSSYNPYVDGVFLGNSATVTYLSSAGQSPVLTGIAPAGTLVKLPCNANASSMDACRAVYFVGNDGKRHAFPNEKVYHSWYPNFSNVTVIGALAMSNLPIGKNITYRPGVKLVKFITNKTVYAVSKGGLLRAVKSESIAAYLYGSTWAKQVDDISDTFFGDYVYGVDIDSNYSYNANTEVQNVPSILANVL